MAILYSYGERSTFYNEDRKGTYDKPNLELEIKPLRFYDEGWGLGYEFYVAMRYKGRHLNNKNSCNRKNKEFSVSSWYQKSITLLDAFDKAIASKEYVIWEADPDPDMIISIYPNRDYPYLNVEEKGLFTIIVSPNTEQYNLDDESGCYGGYEGISYVITASEEDFVKFVADLKAEFKAFEHSEGFPFKDVNPMQVCNVCNHIVNENYPILKVIYSDFGWKFLCGTVDNEEDDDLALGYETFKNIFERDKSISPIAQMDKYHIAQRKDVNSEWIISDLFPFKNTNPSDKCWACSHIVDSNAQVHKVIRNKIGWHFLCVNHTDNENCLSSLNETTFEKMVEKYPDISLVGDMKENYVAQRISDGWCCSPIDDAKRGIYLI